MKSSMSGRGVILRLLVGLLTSFLAVQSVTVLAAESTRLAQCERDLCGPDAYYQRVRGQGPFALVDRETRALLDKELKPVLANLMQSSLQIKKMEYALAESFLNKSGQSLNSATRAFLTMSVYQAKLDDYIFDVVISKDGRKYEIDPDLLKKALPELTSVQVQQMTSVMNAYYASDSFMNYISFGKYSFDLFRRSRGNGFNVLVSETRQRAEELFKELGPIVGEEVDLAVLRKVESGQKLSAAEEFRVMDSLSYTMRFAAKIDPEVIKLTDQLNMTYQTAAKFLGWNDKLKNMKKLFADEKNLQQQKKQILLSCESSISGALAATPSDLRQRKTDELLALVKKAAIETAPLYFSGATLNKVRETVTATQFSKPLSRTEARGLTTESLAYFVQKFKIKNQDLQATQRSGSGNLSWKSLTEFDSDRKNVFSGVQSVCDRLKPEFFIDMAVPWANRVQSGWQTNMFPEVGVGILAHELAHVISKVTDGPSENKLGFTEVRACAIEGHAKLAKSENVSAFAQYAEEDWADAFAATAVSLISKDWPHLENYSCSAIHAADPTDQDKLELQDVSGVESHSTNMLRALQTQVQLGRPLPPSCLQVLTDVEKEVVTRSCAK
jgi:hypothetical protein